MLCEGIRGLLRFSLVAEASMVRSEKGEGTRGAARGRIKAPNMIERRPDIFRRA